MGIKGDINTAPVITFARHRLATDGQGVTTLVCFHGCPLRCKYCINPFSFSPDTKYEQISTQELYDRIKIDELYFLATNGGVTFGGGEPLLYPDFLTSFREICGESWHNCIETSLNVPRENVVTASRCIDGFIVDIKDINREIYRSYTGKDNSLVVENLKTLIDLTSPDRIKVRVPLIPNYNTQKDLEDSVSFLKKLCIENIETFEYTIPQDRENLFKKV